MGKAPQPTRMRGATAPSKVSPSGGGEPPREAPNDLELRRSAVPTVGRPAPAPHERLTSGSPALHPRWAPA